MTFVNIYSVQGDHACVNTSQNILISCIVFMPVHNEVIHLRLKVVYCNVYSLLLNAYCN